MLASRGVVNGADQVYRLTVVPHGLVMVGTHVVHKHAAQVGARAGFPRARHTAASMMNQGAVAGRSII